MAYTYTKPLGALIGADLAPWMTDHLAWYVDSLAGMFEPTWDIVSEQGTDGQPGFLPGYGVLLDVDSCPASGLGYLGQYVGVAIPAGSSESTARALVRNKAGFQRGTAAAIIGAAQAWLTGTQSVSLFERTASNGTVDAYHFILVVRPEEVVDLTKLTAAVSAVKPGGVMFTVSESDSYEWVQAVHTWAADTFSWQSTSSTQP